MTTKLNQKFAKSFLSAALFFLYSYALSPADSSGTKWMIGAEKFKYVSHSSEDEAVSSGIAEMFPNRIMEKLNEEMVHIVYPDEKLDETLYDLRKERLSLFLQLSSEYKKRDALMLQNYSKRKLNSKIKEEEKSIKEIQEKIAKNLQQVDEAVQKSYREEKLVKRGMFNQEDMTEGKSFENMMRSMFSKDSEFVASRNISFYKDDQAALFQASDSAQKGGYESYAFEKEAVSAGIKTLITGTITNYGEYYFVSVNLYEYPGAKVNKSVSEIGLIEDADFISASIAHQIIIALTNGMPVDISISVEPEEIARKVRIYLDDLIQPPGMFTIRTESGVHSLRFVCDGWRETGTSFHFAGDRAYNVKVTMSPETEYYINVVNLEPVPGMFYAGGAQAEKVCEELTESKIRINGNQILGQFITDDGLASSYYIPEEILKNGNLVAIKSKNYDINDYIDKRRRIMYGSYTLLMLSMIPYFYTYGNYYNASSSYNSGVGDYSDALTWQTRNQICMGVSIGCGALFVYELIRYFTAVNSVLPQRAREITPEKVEKKRSKAFKKNTDENIIKVDEEES